MSNFCNYVESQGETVVSYETRITWINYFDGRIENYKRFIAESERALGGADKEISFCLLRYLKKVLNNTPISKYMHHQKFNSWRELKKFLNSYFEVHFEPFKIKQQILLINRLRSESTFNFYHRCCGLLNDYENALEMECTTECKLGCLIKEAEEAALYNFISSMDERIREIVFEKEFNSIHEAFKYVENFETRFNSSAKKSAPTPCQLSDHHGNTAMNCKRYLHCINGQQNNSKPDNNFCLPALSPKNNSRDLHEQPHSIPFNQFSATPATQKRMVNSKEQSGSNNTKLSMLLLLLCGGCHCCG